MSVEWSSRATDSCASSWPTTAKASRPKTSQRIFSVFESKKGARGTGLGLPVSQKILREHGGDIRVESTLGVGSRFYLELPVSAADEVRATQPNERA